MRNAAFPAILMAAAAGFVTVELMSPVPTSQHKPHRNSDFAVSASAVVDESGVINRNSTQERTFELELTGDGE